MITTPTGLRPLPSEASRTRGSWERDPSHFPLPLTPMFASLYLPWQDAALAAMFAEFGYLAERVESRLIDGYMYFRVLAAGGITPPPWAMRTAARLWWAHPGVRARVRYSERMARENHMAAVLTRWENEWRPRSEGEIERVLGVQLSALDDEGLTHHLDRVCRQAGERVRLHFILHGAIAPAIARLEFLLRDTPALAGVRLGDLLAGLSAATSRPGQALNDLAAYLRDCPNRVARARTGTPDDVDPVFAAEFRTWLHRYGHRITNRYEFIEQTPAESPDQVLSQIVRLAERPAAPASAQPPAERRQAAVAVARDRLNEYERLTFDAALAAAQRAYPVRDDNVVLTFNTSFALVRYTLLEAGRRLAGPVLAERDDIFFLTFSEVQAVLRGDAESCGSARLHAAARRRTWERQCAAPPPPAQIGPRLSDPPLDPLPQKAAFMTAAIAWYMRGIMAGSGEQPTPSVATDTVRGLGAVRGRYTGIARIIRDESAFDRLGDGDVLVCPMTSPAWSSLFPIAGALVTDHGGALSHPAVIAREYGIPAVVATQDATRRIPDGATVTVDGDAGTVEVVNPAVS